MGVELGLLRLGMCWCGEGFAGAVERLGMWWCGGVELRPLRLGMCWWLEASPVTVALVAGWALCRKRA